MTILLNQIRGLRKAKGISQKRMAELLEISQPGYQKIEQGKNVLSISRFLDICRILEIDSYNAILPAVNAENVEKIETALLSGYLAFKNIRKNCIYSRKLLDDLIEKVEEGNIEKDALLQELRFFDNYLALIGRDSSSNEYQLLEIKELVEKID